MILNPAFRTQIWAGPLAESKVAVAIVNLESTTQSIELNSTSIQKLYEHQPVLTHNGSSSWQIIDAFAGSFGCQRCTLPQTYDVGPHDTAFLVLSSL